MMVAKDKPEASPSTAKVDEMWLAEWIAYGIAELEISLAKHAAFDAYYEHREKEAA